jgi:DNA-binding transcriptional LysR family regulator
MNLKQIEAFCWIARLGSFAAAAEHLNATQPAISARIRELESSLGLEVFDRSTRRVQLTPKGRHLLDYAERIAGLCTEVRGIVGDRTALRGVVRLGAADNIALSWLPGLICRIGEEYPGILVELFVDLSTSLREKMLSHELDVALLVGPVPGPGIATASLGRVDVAMMTSPQLVTPRGPVRPKDIVGFPIISHTRGSHLYVMMQEWFRRGGIEPPRFHACTSVATLIKLTDAGVGLGVLPPALVREELAKRRLRIVQTAPPMSGFEFVVAYPAVDLQPASKLIVQLAIEAAARNPLTSAAGPGDRGTKRGRPRKQHTLAPNQIEAPPSRTS